MGDVYQAERILDTKTIKGRRFFLIKWHGWDDSNNTWEPRKNILDTRLIDVFFKNLKKKTEKNLNSSRISSDLELYSETSKPKEKHVTNSQSSSKNEKSISSSSSRSRKVSNSANPNKTTQKTSCYEFDDEDSLEIDDSKLRSAIREAEGLRPIVKQSPKTPLKKTVKKQSILPNKKSNQESSDDDSSNSSTEKLNNSKSSTHTKSIRATSKNFKLNKRRKTSSSLSFSSSSSSLIPSKKKLSLTNKKNVKKNKRYRRGIRRLSDKR